MIINIPEKVEICPNGLHVGSFVTPGEWEAWGKEELVMPNSEVVCIDVSFDDELVLMLVGEKAILNKLELFTQAHPFYFRKQLKEQLSFVPEGYNFVELWEVNQQLDHKLSQMFDYKQIPF